jgi:ubiquinone biosynthesis protein COQ7
LAGASVENSPPSSSSVVDDEARRNLIALLQLAHSGELAATHAYDGHARSLRDPVERREVEQIKAEEVDHRGRVRAMLDAMGVAPEMDRERKMARIGKLIGAYCRIGGWFGPMYGAGRFERKNIGEYERAAAYAIGSGHAQFVEDLIHMAEVEWEHERYFREKAASHRLWRLFPKWDPPPPKSTIRAGVEELLSSPCA